MADFRINVIVDPSRVPQGTRVVERSLTRVENRADLLRTTLRRTFGFLAGGAAILGAVRSIAQFEESIATARAVTRATGEEFELLRNRALELGATTRFSATQAADALVNLSRAGFSVNEAISSVDDTLKLAQAAGLGLAEASDIAASTLRGFGLAVDQAERVTDVLVETANRANTNVGQLGEGIKFVAPVAAALGRSIEETSAALGVLSDAGLKATLAGTGLRRVLAELAAPGEKLQSVLTTLGLSVEDINPKTNDLADVLSRLETVGNDAGLALEVFGQRGGPAFLNLVRNVPKIRELNEQLNNSAGTASKVAETLDNTLNGALFRARSALDALVQSFGIAGGSDFLINTLDGIAASLRFLADNIEVVTNVTLALAVVIGIRTLGSAILASQAALRSLALTMVLYRGNVLAAAAAVVKLNVASLANPWLAAAAAITVAVVALKEYVADLNQAGKVLERLEDDARKSFNSQGQQIRLAAQEINNLNRIRERQGFLSESQTARVNELTRAIEGEKDEIREAAERQKELNEAQAAGATTVENLLARLDRQAEALRDITRETENRQRVEQEIQTLLQAGVIPTAGEREEIANRIARNAALEDQRRLLDEIRGPQEQFARQEAALNALLAAGSITAGEFKVKLDELKDSLGGFSDESGVIGVDQNSLERLRESVGLLEIAASQGELAAQATELENQLRADGVEITREVQDEIANLLLREMELTEELKKQRDIQQEQERIRRREERALDALERRIDGQRAIADEQRRLNQLLEDGRINGEQFARAMEDIELRGLEASTTLEAGFERAFIKLKREAEDLASVGERIVNVFADRATEALVEFATTGQFSFKEFASAILQDLIRIIARLLIVQAITAAIGIFGGGGGTAGAAANVGANALSGQFEHGGTMQPGRSYLVGENGPEIVQADRTAAVFPIQQTQERPEVNVQVVNVKSEDEIPQTINDGAADEAIVNALARNKDRVRQVIQ